MTTESGTKPPLPFSSRSFALGLAGGGAALLLLFAYLALNGAATIAARQEKLAAHTVIIERTGALFGPFQPAQRPPEEAAPVEEALKAPPAEPGEAGVARPETPMAAEAITLPRAPVDGLYEDTVDGRLPVTRKSDKLTPFAAYRRPFTPVPGKRIVSIVVMDLGISDTATKSAIANLAPDVSLVIDPYSTNPDFWSTEARNAGHEIWLKLPVESSLYPMDDTGPQTLMINALEKQNINKLNWVLSRTTGYAGVVTDEDPNYIKAANAARPVLNSLFARGLGFVDGDTTPEETPASIAAGLGAPYGHNDVWVDVPATTAHVAASLRQLEVLAEGNGQAVGFIHATPLSLEMLQRWISGLPDKNIVLAPLSAQAKITASP
ncbi:MAG: divergent polysaccharide deacetylase family protein [Micavibrio aeruginosavorus]|nr:divergent polysaccharide deacetylase family protein [Micavibrio aeruginosavorus]